MTPVTIPLSKGKMLLAFLGSCAFVALGCWLWDRRDHYAGFDHAKALFGAVSCMVFFGALALVQAFKLFDQRAGLVMDGTGIYRMGLFSYQPPIRWENITHLSEARVQRTRLLLVHVNNTAEILATMKPFRRWLQRMSLSRYGTPCALSSNQLKCDFGELKDLIQKGVEGWRAKQ